MTIMAGLQHTTTLTTIPTLLTDANPHPSPSTSPIPTCLRNIAVIGAGYVGLSNAILLAQAHLKMAVMPFDIKL